MDILYTHCSIIGIFKTTKIEPFIFIAQHKKDYSSIIIQKYGNLHRQRAVLRAVNLVPITRLIYRDILAQ